MNTNKLGDMGKTAAIMHFLQKDFAIFNEYSAKAPFDFVAYRDDGLLLRVEVKSTKRERRKGAYEFSIRRSYGRSTGNVYKPFNKNNSDILACYIEPINILCFVATHTVNNDNTFTLSKSTSSMHRQVNLIDAYLNLDDAIQKFLERQSDSGNST